MTIKNNAVDKSVIESKSYIFEVKGQALAFLWFICINYFSFLVVLNIAFYEKQTQFTINSFLGIMLFIVLYGMGVVNMAYTSDLIIDSIGISRRYLGYKWRILKWDNVKNIRRLFTSNGFGKIQRTYNVFPTKKPLIRFLASGKMTFPEEAKDAHKLTELLNFYILQYNIPVEVRETPYGEFIAVKTLNE